jgi:cis-3-alkyl-4-acyloxetan-2-one decarboxylase
VEKLPAPTLPAWLERMVPFERYHLRVRGHLMHVMETGNGKGQPVLMLHGNPTWGFLYRKVAAALAGEDLRIVMPDLLGLGFSDHPTDSRVHTLALHAGLIRGLIDLLGLENPIFVGQDWGGPIGACALAERGAAVKALVILNTVLFPPKEGFRPAAFHRFARMPLVSDLAFRLLGFPQRALGRAQGDRSSISGDVSKAYRLPLAGLRNNVAPLALARMVPDSHQHPTIERLLQCQEFAQGFQGPVEVVWGDRDPVLGRVIGRMERLFPRARVTRTAGGHFLQEEFPEEIAAAIKRVAS